MQIAVSACGLVTALGFNAAASLAAIRAGIRNVRETNLWDPESGAYLSAGKVDLPHWWVGPGKLADLVAPAIWECLNAAQSKDLGTIPVILCLPSSRYPSWMEHLDSDLFPEIEEKLNLKLHAASRLLRQGSVSVVSALTIANQIIACQIAPSVVVAAVDSLLIPELKNRYLTERRLLTPTNSNGFSLGEAGTAVLVEKTGKRGKGELVILSAEVGFEPASVGSGKPLRGEGMTQLLGRALEMSGIGIDDVHYRLADLNGEHHKFKELTLAFNRLGRRISGPPLKVWHPIECLGNVGAAIGPLLLSVALHSGRHRYCPGITSLCTLGNDDDGHRAALVLKYYEDTPV